MDIYDSRLAPKPSFWLRITNHASMMLLLALLLAGCKIGDVPKSAPLPTVTQPVPAGVDSELWPSLPEGIQLTLASRESTSFVLEVENINEIRGSHTVQINIDNMSNNTITVNEAALARYIMWSRSYIIQQTGQQDIELIPQINFSFLVSGIGSAYNNLLSEETAFSVNELKYYYLMIKFITSDSFSGSAERVLQMNDTNPTLLDSYKADGFDFSRFVQANTIEEILELMYLHYLVTSNSYQIDQHTGQRLDDFSEEAVRQILTGEISLGEPFSFDPGFTAEDVELFINFLYSIDFPNIGNPETEAEVRQWFQGYIK